MRAPPKTRRFQNLESWITFFIVISPLIYSNDGDKFRAYEVVMVGTICALVAIRNNFSGLSLTRDMALVLAYAALVIAQQSFIRHGSMMFGIQYAVVLTAMFVPLWSMKTISVKGVKFLPAVHSALFFMSVVTILSIYVSFFLGVGEVQVGRVSRRAFAWLGDSYTPVIAFLIMYFALRRNWVLTSALSLALLMTGGKMSMIMLIAAPVVYMLATPSTILRKVSIVSALLLLGFGIYMGRSEIYNVFFSNAYYSYNTRAISNELGIRYFLQNPFFGIGVNNSLGIITQDSSEIVSAMRIKSYEIYQIHNAFVRTAAETGVFGILIFLGIALTLILRATHVLSRAYRMTDLPGRSLVIASSLWVVCFILLYQTTGWFEAGHPQLAWLLMIWGIGEGVFNRGVRRELRRSPFLQQAEPRRALRGERR